MQTPFDTIAAIATAAGPAGIAVIRMSGPDAAQICGRVIFHGKSGSSLTPDSRDSHRIFYGRAIDPVSGSLLDEVMVAWMAAPRSFTTEDTIEISCHGGNVAVSSVLRALLAAGARAANPGEFTFRALVHGRLSLTEAEAVLQVISAQTSDGLDRALEDLRGDLARRITPARAAVVSALAYLDASADFPDDEIQVSDVRSDLQRASETLTDVLAGAKSGRLLTDGATVALVGRPNVGKSSLLNALLRSDRAIVTPIAGTTRDVVSERALIDGIPVLLMDTAGVTESVDLVEQAGIARSRNAIERASALIVVLDGSVPISDEDRSILQSVRTRFATGALGDVPVVLVCNKSDLGTALDFEELRATVGFQAQGVCVSAQTGDGLAALETAIGEVLRSGIDPSTRPSLLNDRQFAELDRALLHVRSAIDALSHGFPTDVLATDVRIAARAIGSVTGEDIDDAVLAELFSRFCIGK